ncbi:glutamine--tRNA ligase [Candidatus Tachikawaea gelatinosa]|nr:glutamine--tRNA ligase [Candidatus Tachikawaea gelatinosa]
MDKFKEKKRNFIRQIIQKDLMKGKNINICTRFPPEPNGYLHIGHAKSICLNFEIAREYKGKCYLRFDDTNPTKENVNFIKSIIKDIKWLGYQWNGKIRYSSDYFDQFYLYAIQLIKKNLAYVDELSPEEIRFYRGTRTSLGIDSPYRNRTIEENLLLFKKMKNGEFLEKKACLRAKIDMKSNFIVMRDPILYRIKYIEHHQTKKKWCIYPMYDFAQCISDALEGITHSICTLEFQDNRRLYEWILDKLNFKFHPKQYEFSRLNIEYSILSKRKLIKLIEEKIVNNWDDPRILTISGLRRRGYTPLAIRNFCEKIGVTKQENLIELSFLESCIRDELNKKAYRLMAVINPLKIVIENFPQDYEEIIFMPNHPQNKNFGMKKVFFNRELWIEKSDFLEKASDQYRRLTLNNEVRLRNAYIIRANKIEKNKKGEIICVYCSCDFDTLNKHPKDGRKIKGVIHWVSIKHGLPAIFHIYDKLFMTKNPNLEDNFKESINPQSLIIKKGFIEPHFKNLKLGTALQFEREGYFYQDTNFSQNIIFNRTVTLKKSF